MESQSQERKQSAVQKKENSESQFGQHPLEPGGPESSGPLAAPVSPPPFSLGGETPVQRSAVAGDGEKEEAGEQAGTGFEAVEIPHNIPEVDEESDLNGANEINPGGSSGVGGTDGGDNPTGGGNEGALLDNSAQIQGASVGLSMKSTNGTNMGDLVQNLGNLSHNQLVPGFMQANASYVAARNADQESAQELFPSIPQPVGLNEVEGDTTQASPKVTPTSEPGFVVPNSSLDSYAASPPGQRVGTNKQNLGDGNGEVDLSAGDREVVKLEGNAHPSQVKSQITAKRNEVLPEYRNSKDAMLQDFGETDVFPEAAEGTMEGAAAFTNSEGPVFPPMQATPQTFIMAEATDSEVRSRFAPLMDKEKAARDSYLAGLETEQTAGETEVSTIITNLKTEQQAQKDAMMAEVEGYRNEWMGENDAKLLEFDSNALKEKATIDQQIQGELDGANLEIQNAYADAETEAQGEYNKKVSENGAPVQALKNGGSVIQARRRFGRRIKKFVKKVADKFVGWAKGLVDGLKNFVQGVWNRLKDKVSGIIDKAKNAIQNFVNTLTEKLTALANNIKNSFNAIKEKFVNAINSAIENLKTTFKQMVAAVKEVVQKTLDAISEAIVSLVHEFKDAIQWALNTMSEILLEFVLVAGIPALRLLFKMFGVPNADAIIDEIARFASVVADIVKNPIGFAKNLIKTIKETFSNYFQNIGDNMSEVFTTWFFGNPDLDLPKDFSAESWIGFGLEASGVDADSLGDMMSTDVALPGGITVDPVAPVQALLQGGPNAMWDNLKGQLSSFPIVEDVSAARDVLSGDGGQNEEEASDEQVKAEVSQMGFDEFMVYAGEYLPAETMDDLNKAMGYYQQLVSGDIAGLVADMGAEMKEQLFNIPQMMKDMAIDWVMTDLLPQLPLLVATLVNPAGGLAKAVKAIVDGIMWCIENKDAIFRVIQTVYNAFNMIASGDIAGASAMITTGINQSIGLLLDLLMEVVVSSSPSKKFGKMVDDLSEKARKGFDTVIGKIKKAFQKFMDAIQKMLGKKKSEKKANAKKKDKGTDKEGDNENNNKVERDYKGDPIPTGEDLDKAIKRKKARLDGEEPIDSPFMGYGSSPDDKRKTYQVLQGVLDAYRKLEKFEENGSVEQEDVNKVADEIRGRHDVFSSFEAVRARKAKVQNFKLPEGESYWAWQWSASPTRTAIAAQALLNDDGTIRDIQISGRPPKAFGGTMGDHSSAFTVQKDAVRTAVLTKTVPDAITAMRKLAKSLEKAPGMLYKDNLDYSAGGPNQRSGHGYRLQTVWDELISLGVDFDPSRTPGTVGQGSAQPLFPIDVTVKGANLDADQNVDLLQRLICLFLEARELIPLSVVKTKDETEDTGKGHGESGARAVLLAYSPQKTTPNEDQVISAIMGLFDKGAVDLAVGASSSAKKNEMLPGSSGVGTASRDVFDDAWKQHLIWICKAYPNVRTIANKIGTYPTTHQPNKEEDNGAGNGTADNVTKARNDLGIMIILDSKQRVERMHSQGRSLSPFTGSTMGAHSVAWILHLDHVEAIIKRKSIPNAFTAIKDNLIPKVQQLINDKKQSQQAAAAATPSSGTKRNRPSRAGAFKGSYEEQEVKGTNRMDLKTIKSDLRKIIAKHIKPNPADATLAGLQELIAEIMAYTNLIEGVTKDKGGLNAGRNESGNRENLYNFEQKMKALRMSSPTPIKTEQDGVKLVRDNTTKAERSDLAVSIAKLQENPDPHMENFRDKILEEAYPWTYLTFVHILNKDLPDVEDESFSDDSMSDSESEDESDDDFAPAKKKRKGKPKKG